MKLAKKGLTTASLNANDPNFDFQFRVDTTGLGSPEHGLMAVIHRGLLRNTPQSQNPELCCFSAPDWLGQLCFAERGY